MISITRRYRFEAAHRLTGMREGHKCARLHGHNYRVELTVTAPLENGMVLDADLLDEAVAPVIARLDHQTINEVPASTAAGQAMVKQPTAEHIAAFLLDAVWRRLAVSVQPLSVTVYENDDLWATATMDAAA